MAHERVLIDTGPLVALLASDDAEHQRCTDQSRVLPKPFLTIWPVIAEAAWLLREQANSLPKLLGLLESGLISCIELDAEAVSEISELPRKYADLKP